MAVSFTFRGTYQIIDNTQVTQLTLSSLYIAVVRLYLKYNLKYFIVKKTGHGVANV